MIDVAPQLFRVAILPKDDETPFFARIPTADDRVVVTSAIATHVGEEFLVPKGMKLFHVEAPSAHVETIETEFFKHDRVRLFFAIDEQHATYLSNQVMEYPHPRPIDLARLLRPSPRMRGPKFQFGPIFEPGKDRLEVDITQLREDLEQLSGARPANVDGRDVIIQNRASSENKSLARKWLRQEFEQLGYTVTEHNYGSGTNLIAEKTTHERESTIILITAHLDTVATAGADDDGSGVITALTTARALAKKHLARTIRFVAFDEEERGLIGSTAYARYLEKLGEIDRVTVINLEMTGYDSDDNGDFHAIDCNENSSSNLTQLLVRTIGAIGLPLTKTNACTNRSDHAVFWDYNRPAIVVSQNFFGGDGNPCYHRTCDTVAKVNFNYMGLLTKAAANAVYQLATTTSHH